MPSRVIQRFKQRKLSVGVGALLTLLVGFVLLVFPRIGRWHANLSYDHSNLIIPSEIPTHALIIYMDEVSYRSLDQSYVELWDRSLHAELLDRLRVAGAIGVVFDVFFSDPGPSPEADQKLAEAMKAHGNVMLAAERENVNDPRLRTAEKTIPPGEIFEKAARIWGIAKVYKEPDQQHRLAVRKLYSGTPDEPSLAWAAASVMEAPVARLPTFEEAQKLAEEFGLPKFFGGEPAVYVQSVASKVRTRSRWLRYYGEGGTIPRLSYHRALRVMSPEQLAEQVQGKVVFIGGKPQTQMNFEQVENFATPYTRQTGEATAGVEVMATMFLNLVRGDWLTRMTTGKEILIVVLTALIFGAGLRFLSPLAGVIAAVLGAAALALAGLMLAKSQSIWFAWAIPAFAQVPCAYLVALIASRVPVSTMVPAGVPSSMGVEISNYQLHECLRRGAFGELWLAQDAQGAFHGVKVVYKERFDKASGYQREFSTLESYVSVSQSHAHLLPLQEVRRQPEFFYAVMAIADDQESGRQINPRQYNPKSLAREIGRHGRLSAENSLQLGLNLVEAVQHLHRENLVHANIKPSNILYVEGDPRLGEIGQAVVVSRTSEGATSTGDSYAPPEGNDSPVSDLYSLGMVLYTASTGLGPDRYPEPPTRASDPQTGELVNDLNRIIAQACHQNPARRFKTASEMHRALLSALNKQVDRKRVTSVPDRRSTSDRIPGYTMLSRIGQGAFGEVWLARNKVGLYQAIKIVNRDRFLQSDPYEREFEGLKHFMGISRSHPGFVHILHVDRDNEAGFFYYSMEAGDDEALGQRFDPNNYKPKSISGELRRRGAFSPLDCLDVMESLSATLQYLHGQNLLHRDIKPANVIFVNGSPKLADIGLVTNMPEHHDATIIGTLGYMAPEGPQNAASDVFSLGMLFYVMLTNRSPDRFDQVPDEIRTGPHAELVEAMMKIIRKACTADPRGRTASAGEVWDAVVKLKETYDENAKPTLAG